MTDDDHDLADLALTARGSGPLRVAIIGAGLSGISQAIQLVRQISRRHLDLLIVEKEDAIGGTWLNSTWPGAGVDVPIHLYSLESEPRADWTSVFAEQREMSAYLEDCVERNDLRSSIVLNTSYLSSTWDDATQTHTLVLQQHGQPSSYRHVCDVLISANGPLSAPKIPRLPGVERFAGVAFHNLRWRAAVREVERDRPGWSFQGKRIAIIGNGSSGIQLLPGLAELPGVVIQQYVRSGGYYFPKVNTAISARERWLYAWLPFYRARHRRQLFDAHDDRWRARNDGRAVGHVETEEMLLAYLEREAPKEYLEALRPRYPLGCKRPAYDAGWLRALHRSNVTLNSSGIREITHDGVTSVDGEHFQADVIIWATGSDVGRHGVGLNVGLYGEEGVELKRFWEDIGGPQSYLGLAFPNYFITLGPNAIAGSWGFTIGNQTATIARICRDMLRFDIGSLQPRREVFEQHNREIQDALKESTMNSADCVNWWRIDGSGRPSVPNPLDAAGLAESTRQTRWQDWIAYGPPNEDKPHMIDVDAKERAWRRQQVTRRGALLLLLAIGATCSWYRWS